MDKQKVVHLYKGIVLSNKKGTNYWYILEMKSLKGQKTDPVVARDWVWGKWLTTKRHKGTFRSDGTIPHLDCGGAFTTVCIFQNSQHWYYNGSFYCMSIILKNQKWLDGCCLLVQKPVMKEAVVTMWPPAPCILPCTRPRPVLTLSWSPECEVNGRWSVSTWQSSSFKIVTRVPDIITDSWGIHFKDSYLKESHAQLQD